MKHLKLFENFDNELEQDEFINSNLEDDYDEKLEQDLSVELEYKLRTLPDESNLTIDDFLMEFGINPEDMTGFAWAAILNGTEKFKEMSDEEFMGFYDDYKTSLLTDEDEMRYDDTINYDTDDESRYDDRLFNDDINEATQGSVDNKSSKAYKSLKKKSEASGISLTTLKQVYKRGMAAWNAGHRPGTPQNAWAMGRVNSFITGAGGARKADSDLWKKAKKSKKKK